MTPPTIAQRITAKEDDMTIISQLYEGNHLNNHELERGLWLCEMLLKEVKRRCKE